MPLALEPPEEIVDGPLWQLLIPVLRYCDRDCGLAVHITEHDIDAICVAPPMSG
jgi:hypothetical protein